MTTTITNEVKRCLLKGDRQHKGQDLITLSDVDDANLHWDSIQITFAPVPCVKFFLGRLHVATMEHLGSFAPSDTLVLSDLKGTLGFNLET